jgi:hypothetical protein
MGTRRREQIYKVTPHYNKTEKKKKTKNQEFGVI